MSSLTDQLREGIEFEHMDGAIGCLNSPESGLNSRPGQKNAGELVADLKRKDRASPFPPTSHRKLGQAPFKSTPLDVTWK